MNINNITNKNEIYLYKTKNFATIRITFYFLMPSDEKTLITATLLSGYLTRTNKKYKTYKKILEKTKELYSLSIDASPEYIGNQNFFKFSISIINPKIIEEDYLTKALEFAKCILFEPNFKNNKLDKEILNELKKEIINTEKNKIANPTILKTRLFLNEIAPDTNISSICNNKKLDETKEIIEKITDKDIIEFYNNLINNKFYKGYIFGDINKQEFNNITKLFPFKPTKEEANYNNYLTIPSKELEITNKDVNVSTLNVAYQLKNYNIDKHYLYKTLSIMIDSGNGLCKQILREEKGLVYSAGAFINKYRFFGFLYISADINYDKKEECLNSIDEIWKRLKNPEIVKELLNYAKEKQNEQDETSDEEVKTIIEDLKDHVLKTKPSREKLHELINNITIEDIIQEIDNIEKRYIFFYKGTKNEK